MLYIFLCKNPNRCHCKQHQKKYSFHIFILTFLHYCKNYSHSMVAVGFELISYTTRFTPLTLLMISLEIFIRNSYGKCTQSAVIPSVDSTALKATTFSYVRSSPITPTLFTGSKIAPACHTLSYNPCSFN